MSSKSALMSVQYVDLANEISLRNFADTIVYDDSGAQKQLCAIRFGGYPEQVEAMSKAIYGGGTIEVTVGAQPLVLNSLVKKYRRKVSHDDVYAECTLIAEDDTQQANDETEETQTENSLEAVYEQEEIADLPPRSSYIFVPPGDRQALFDAVDQKTAVPLIPEFADYLLGELEHRKILIPLKMHSSSPQFEAWVLKCESNDKNIIKVVEDGLSAGIISIPGVAKNHSEIDFGDVNSVTE